MNIPIKSLFLSSVLLSTVSGCSFSKQEVAQVQLEIALPSAPAASNFAATTSSSSTGGGMALPASIGEFSCIAVNIYGSGVDQTQLLPGNPGSDIPSAQQTRVSAPAGCAYPGIQSAAIPFSGGSTIQLTVPSGKSRGIQIIGIKSANPCAGASLRNILETMITANGEHGYVIAELGSTSADLFGDTTVRIANSFNPAKVKFPFHCLDDIYYRMNHRNSGPGYYIRQMVAGSSFTCALLTDSRVQCWGKNDYGQLGRGFATGMMPSPDYVAGPNGSGVLEAVQEISAGNEHACAITGNGNVVCWGYNDVGQLGVSVASSSSTYPVYVTQPDKISNVSNPSSSTGQLYSASKLASGGNSNCVIRNGDTPVCWGAGASGQLGNSSSVNSSYPREVYNFGGAYRIFGGQNNFCAINGSTSGSQGIYCWGEGSNYQIGNGGASAVNIPTAVTSLSSSISVQSIAVASNSVCAIANGTKYCWGNNGNFEWGSSGAGSSASTPQNLNSTQYSEIFAGNNGHMCGINAGSRLMECWGNNTSGQVGNGSSGGSVSSATSPANMSTVLQQMGTATAGANHTCFNTGDSAWCWGMNTYGQLGPISAGTGIVAYPVQVLMRKP